jgi:hypothetical protein
MNPLGFLDRRVRGVRIVDLAGGGLLCGLILVVYLAKTGAGGTAADIDHVQQQIDQERGQIRLLQAEVASEEQPKRMADLSDQVLHLQPIAPKHEIPTEALADIAHVAPPKAPAAQLIPTAPALASPTAVALAATSPAQVAR